MNQKLFKAAILLISIFSVFVSCKKDELPEQYLRGGNNLVLATDGNIVIAGYNTYSGKGFDGTIIKTSSSNGDTIWSRNFGGTYSDALFCIKNANNGGYIAVGFSNKASSSSPAMLAVITDENGNLVKSTTYGSSNSSQAFAVTPHLNADSGYVLAGYIQKTGRTDRDIYLVKINNEGVQQWDKTIGARSTNSYDTVHDAAYSIIPAADSGYYITGSLNGNSSCCGKIFLMKVSATGDSLWTRTFFTGIGYSLTLTSDGGVAISGTIQETNDPNVILIKTDADGNLLWSRTYGGTGYEYGASLVETHAGGFAITGITNSAGAGLDDIYLVLTGPTGDQIVTAKTFGGEGVDQGYGIIQHANGEFSIAGLSNTGGSFIYVNRTTIDGAELWFKNIK